MAALMTIEDELLFVVLIYGPPVNEQQLVNLFIEDMLVCITQLFQETLIC